jgi:hypothetical protein
MANVVFENSEPWPAVFNKVASRLDDRELLELWNAALVHGMARDSLLCLPTRLGQRIARLLDSQTGTRYQPIGHRSQLLKRNHQYYVRTRRREARDSEYLVLDADVQIRQLEQANSDYLCRGIVIHRGQTTSFTVKLRELESDFGKWLRTFTLKHRLGYIFLAPTWNERILRYLLLFHPPLQLTRNEVRAALADAQSASAAAQPATIEPSSEDQGTPSQAEAPVRSDAVEAVE